MISEYEYQLKKELDEIESMLKYKNKKYGNSIFTDGILFQIDPEVGIKARINDKLARWKNQNSDEDEDVLRDLIGYLIQLRIYKKHIKEKDIKQLDIPF